MVRRLPQLFVLIVFAACFCTRASADQVAVGDLSFDAATLSATSTTFDITNLTGTAGVDIGDPADFPVTTPLIFTVTSVTVNLSSGGPVVLSGSDFTSVTGVFPGDEDVDCTVLPACDLECDSITSAVLTGTISPTTGIAGLPAGDTGITGAMTDAVGDAYVTITPGGCGDGATVLETGCDTAIIYATGTAGVTPAPEPGTLAMTGLGMIGLLIGRKRLRGFGRRRISNAVA
jgi:hypothetical protein